MDFQGIAGRRAHVEIYFVLAVKSDRRIAIKKSLHFYCSHPTASRFCVLSKIYTKRNFMSAFFFLQPPSEVYREEFFSADNSLEF